jgi:hypothetical protein
MQRPPVGIGFGILVIAVALCVVPFKRMTAPHWYIRVTNADGSPASNILVREEANDYSCGSGEQEEDVTSNKDGQIEFAPKHIRTTVAHCIFQTIKSAEAGAHASFGHNTWAFPIGADGYILDKNGNIYSWSGNPGVLHSRLILKH